MSVFEDDLGDVSDALRQTARGISGGGNAVVSGLRTLATGLLGGAAGGLLTSPLVLGFGALAIGTGALISAFKSATDEATKYSRVLASLRANQGLSLNRGFELTGANAVLGISPQQTAQMFAGVAMNPTVTAMRARALGLTTPYAPYAMEKNARAYQAMASKGVFGRMMANSRLDALYGGQAPDAVREAMNLRPGAIAGNLAYGARMRRDMGVTGETMRAYTEDIPLARARGSYAWDTMKVKLAVELAPLLERSLTTFATVLANNAPKIRQGLEAFGTFMVQKFPPMVLRAGAWIARGLGGMLKGFGGFAQGLAGNVRPMLRVFDTILNGLRTFGGIAAGIGAALIQGIGTLYNGLKKSGIWGLMQKLGALFTGNGNTTQTNKVTNQALGTLATFALGKPVARGLWALGKWGFRAAMGAGAGGAGAGAAGAGGGGTLGFGALLSNPIGLSVAAGTALGVAGYEGLRKTGIGPWKDMPSGVQMIKYGAYRAQGYSQNDAGRMAQGLQTQAQYNAAQKAQRAQQRAAAQAARNPLSAFAYNPQISVQQAFQNGQNGFMGNIGFSQLANSPHVGTLERMFGGAGGAANAGGDKLNSFADYLDKSANNYESEMANQLKALAAASRQNGQALEKIERNTDKGAQSQADLLNNFPDMMRQLVALTSAFIAQDAAMSILGT